MWFVSLKKLDNFCYIRAQTYDRCKNTKWNTQEKNWLEKWTEKWRICVKCCTTFIATTIIRKKLTTTSTRIRIFKVSFKLFNFHRWQAGWWHGLLLRLACITMHTKSKIQNKTKTKFFWSRNLDRKRNKLLSHSLYFIFCANFFFFWMTQFLHLEKLFYDVL